MKVAASGTNHDMDIATQLLSHNRDKAFTRRHAALDWIAQQLDPISPTAFRSNGRFDRMHRNFDNHFLRSAPTLFRFGIVTSRNFRNARMLPIIPNLLQKNYNFGRIRSPLSKFTCKLILELQPKLKMATLE
jgi:hypothetical protein